MTRNHGNSDATDANRTSLATAISRRATGLALAFILVGVALTPAAAADTTEKTVCLGDSAQAEHPAQLGSGCADGWIETNTKWCEEQDDGLRDCMIEGRLGVTVTGAQTCGASQGNWFDNSALTCVSIPKTIDGESSDITAWEEIQLVTDVPPEGKTVEVPAETCTWADRTSLANTVCDAYDHPHKIDPADGASGLQIVDGTVDYAKTTVETAESPVTLAP